MELGTRSIRSAGQGSGSIEVTLPSPLRDLTGIACRIALRDGLRPEIVLAPDLRPAREALGRLWTCLAEGWGASLGALPLAEIGIALRPSERLDQLAWIDALALSQPAPHQPEALCRALRAMAAHAAVALGLPGPQAPGFAGGVAYALTGLVPMPTDQEACDIAAATLSGRLPALGDDAFAPAFWQQAGPALRRLLELHQDLAAHPERMAALRRAWRQGVALELTGE